MLLIITDFFVLIFSFFLPHLNKFLRKKIMRRYAHKFAKPNTCFRKNKYFEIYFFFNSSFHHMWTWHGRIHAQIWKTWNVKKVYIINIRPFWNFWKQLWNIYEYSLKYTLVMTYNKHCPLEVLKGLIKIYCNLSYMFFSSFFLILRICPWWG